MNKKNIDDVVDIVMVEVNNSLASICEEKIKYHLHGYIVHSIKEIICNAIEFRPILEECFSKEAEKIIAQELKKIKMPVTISQVAALLGISEAAVYKRKERGQLDFEKVNGRYYISLQELSNTLLSKEQKSIV